MYVLFQETFGVWYFSALWFRLRSMKASNSRDALFCSFTSWSGGQETKWRNKIKYVPVNYHLLLVALWNCLLLEASCSCHQRCFWIKTLELELWRPRGKGVAPDLKPAAWVPLASLPHSPLRHMFPCKIKCLKGCSVGALLRGEKRDRRWGEKIMMHQWDSV